MLTGGFRNCTQEHILCNLNLQEHEVSHFPSAPLKILFDIDIDIFVNCNWVDTQ